ncbi:MAG: hypothetical protein PHU14_04615 [Methylovulum sp.]|nr:hypothetical protein [Methylovulum sp.]
MLFGLACEGVTDQITIENILCGYFDNPDLDEAITRLQPPFDETTQKQKVGEIGGWTGLLNHYLGSQRFREDVLNTQFIIIQVDTDVAPEKGFDVAHSDAENNPLTPEALIDKVVSKLIAIIDSGEQGFYQQQSAKIIFAISVHSLECWLYAHYNKQSLNKPKIVGCFDALDRLAQKDKKLPKPEKTYRCYNDFSRPFLARKHIDAVAAKDPSFRVFIRELAKIEEQIFQL